MAIAPQTLVLLITTVSGLSAQQIGTCPLGTNARGDLGIRHLRCEAPAAACAINTVDSNGTLHHQFSVEPIIVHVERGMTSPSVRVGDVLVAIDSTLITTRQGGVRLAKLAVGAPVRVLLRRDGRLMELRVTAGRGCGITSLSVTRP